MRENWKLRKDLDELYIKERKNPMLCKKTIREYLEKAEKDNDIYVMGVCYYYLASINIDRGMRTDILSYAIKAANLLDNTTDYVMIVKCYNLLGIAYSAQEDYHLALEAYNRSSQIGSKHRIKALERIPVRNNIAECYFLMGDFATGKKILRECLDTVRKIAPEHHTYNVIIAVNLSVCCEGLKEYREATELLESVEDRVTLLDEPTDIAIYHARCACLAYVMGDEERGHRYADLTYSEIKNRKDTFEAHRDLETMARIQINLGDYERANRFADILTNYAVKSEHTLDKIIACRVQAAYYFHAGQKDKALEYYVRLNGLYEQRKLEENAMRLSTQKKLQNAYNETRRLLNRVRKSEEKADRDPFTRLLNRGGLLKTANEFATLAIAKTKTRGGIFIDIDFFKGYNDTYGHAKGDDVVKAVANACIAEETPYVRFARYGGDEFFGITVGQSEEELAEIAKRIAKRIRDAAIPHEKNIQYGIVTLSIGIVNIGCTDYNNTILDIVNSSDKALYHAKAEGKNAIYLFDYKHFDSDGNRDPYIRIE